MQAAIAGLQAWLATMTTITTSGSSPPGGGIALALAVLAAAACWWAAVRRVRVRRVRLRSFHAIPSPPGALPFVGHILQWLLHGPAQAHELYLRWHEAHGGIVRVRLLHRDVVLIADPAAAAQVLAAGPNECARRTPEYALFDAVRWSLGGRSLGGWVVCERSWSFCHYHLPTPRA
jgi:hypothetical protein